MKTKKQLPNNTAVLRSEVDTQEKLDALVEVAKYQGFNMSMQSNCRLVVYSLDYIHVDKTCRCLMKTDNFKTINIITLDEFLSYGEPKASWHERGELPPVGEKCLSSSRLGNCEVTIKKYNKKCDAACIDSNGNWLIQYAGEKFKPLPPEKTERELAVEEMLMLKHEKWVSDADKEFAGILHDKGYHNGKKMKPLPSNWRQIADRTHKTDSEWVIYYCGIEIETAGIAKGES